MQRTIAPLFAALLAAPLLLAASVASAAPSKASCGNIELAANGECEFRVDGGCVTECEPLNFTAACDGQCSGSVEAKCAVDCSGSCAAECKVNPGSIDCEGSCELDCSGSCEAQCAAESDKAGCSAYCKGSCSNSCQAKCTTVAPSASCQAKCEAKCTGSCEAKAEFDCSYECSSTLTGGCKTDCTEPRGALFCNGQYVDVSETNLDDCVAYLQSQLNYEVDYEAHGHCDASGCTGEANAAVGCSAAPGRTAPLDVGAIAAMVVGLGLVVSRRRRA